MERALALDLAVGCVVRYVRGGGGAVEVGVGGSGGVQVAVEGAGEEGVLAVLVVLVTVLVPVKVGVSGGNTTWYFVPRNLNLRVAMTHIKSWYR